MPPSSLRVAFFGSDAFSVASLRRLFELKRSHPNLISQLDVYTRSIKPTGRNLKQYVDLPIGLFAAEKKLPVYRVDSGSEILASAMPRKYDLAVAVSYGKLIPGKFLQSLTYGGLNVHPSILPKFSGSSPIQHALMNDCKTTGVTIQTLHPTKFDHGDIICQSGPIKISENDNFISLQTTLSQVGADLLAVVISAGIYVDPKPLKSPETYSLAPKLTPSMSEIVWEHMTSRQIRRLNDALGPLHSHKYVDILKKKNAVQGYYKVILDGIEEFENCSELEFRAPGDFALSGDKLIVKTCDSYVTVRKLKFQYCGLENATEFMRSLPKRSGETPHKFVRAQS